MATPIKRMTTVKMLHVCAEEERLKRIELILIGNGHPEEGYIYKVMDMGKQIGDINTKLTGISTVVAELYSESTSKKEVIKTTREKRNEWIKVAMFIVGALSLIVLAYNSFKGTEISAKNSQKLDNIGIPLVTNSRGNLMILPDSTLIKYFPNDSVKYIVKRIK